MSLARRNALLARLERSRKATVLRNRSNTLRAAAKTRPASSRKGGLVTGNIVRTCECGRVIKGSTYFKHRKVCAIGKGGD